MFRIALRDLQWRRRRFASATLGVAVVFGLTLVITGVSSGFLSESENTVQEMGASVWVVRSGADGPFLGSSPFSGRAVRDVSNLPGVINAVPTVYTHRDVVKGNGVSDVNVFGAPTGNLGMPPPSQGRQPAASDQIMISTALKGYPIGSHLLLAGHRFTVVGLVENSTALAGTPNVFLTLPAAQRVAFAGLDVASAIAVRGTVGTGLPTGLATVTNADARADLLRALGSARSSIALMSVLLWLVAAMIVGSIVYVSVLERQRDFAVFKATGTSTSYILWSLGFQAVALSLVAAAVGVVVAFFIKPLFPLPVTLTLRAFLLLPAIAVLIGLVASFFGLRKAVSVEPALAFGGP